MPTPISLPLTPPPMRNIDAGMMPPALAANGLQGGLNVTSPPTINFSDLLQQSLEEVNTLDGTAQSNIARSLAGEDLTQAEVFTSVRKADLALRTMLQIRNKLLDAYREVQQMRM